MPELAQILIQLGLSPEVAKQLQIKFTNLSVNELSDVNDWQTWTPTGYDGGASMTWSSVTATNSKYLRLGNTCWLMGRFLGETGGTANDTLIIEGLPFASEASGSHAVSLWVLDGAGSNVAGLGFTNAGTELRARRYDNASFGIGTNRGIYVGGFFEIAS